MGLDMYLTAEKYIPAYDDKMNEEFEHLKLNSCRVKSINYDVGYWRKANAIHGWFVDNVQDENDDCRATYVSIEKLKSLLDLCVQVKCILDEAQEDSTYEKNVGFSKESDPSRWEHYDNVKFEKSEFGYNVYATFKCYNNDTQEECCKLLPPTEGFFFGNTRIDKYYLVDICNTIKIINRALELNENAGGLDFQYQASW